MKPDQGRDIFKAPPAVCGFLAQSRGFIVAAEALEDCGTLAIRDFGIERKSLGTIQVAQSICKSMEDRPGPRSPDKSHSVGGLVAHESLGNLLCPLVVGDVAQDEPAKREQVN